MSALAQYGHCENCGGDISYGPNGGYVCPNCSAVVEPRDSGAARVAADRERAIRVTAAAAERAAIRLEVAEQQRQQTAHP